jgi:hypothetical protein
MSSIMSGGTPQTPESPPVTRADVPDTQGPSMQVQKIHDVRTHLAGGMGGSGPHAPKRIGVVNMRFTRILAFMIISAAVVACSVVCVLAVWEYVESDFAWRALASLGIISAATAIFVSLNEGFGPLVRE